MIIEFFVPVESLLNANQRLHWAVVNRRRKHLRMVARSMARGHQRFDTARVDVIIAWPRAHRRDPANWADTAKPIMDGLVDAGIVVDDSARYVQGPFVWEGTPTGDKFKRAFIVVKVQPMGERPWR